MKIKNLSPDILMHEQVDIFAKMKIKNLPHDMLRREKVNIFDKDEN